MELLHYINKNTCSETKQKNYTQYQCLAVNMATTAWHASDCSWSAVLRTICDSKIVLLHIRQLFFSRNNENCSCKGTSTTLQPVTECWWPFLLSGLRLLSGWSVVFNNTQIETVLKEITVQTLSYHLNTCYRVPITNLLACSNTPTNFLLRP